MKSTNNLIQQGIHMKVNIICSLLVVTTFAVTLNAAPSAGSTLEQKTQTTLEALAKETKARMLPTDIKLELTTGGTTTLADLMKGKKAILLDFWATFCGPCMRSMPELKHKAEVLIPQKVAVAAINVDSGNSKNKVEKIRADQKIDFAWLIDGKNHFYMNYFGIKAIPHMILLSGKGEILFRGHPNDTAGLKAALSKLDVKL